MTNSFEKKKLSSMEGSEKPLLLTERERIDIWKARLNEDINTKHATNMCKVLGYEETEQFMEQAETLAEYDVIYIDNSDLFFRFITSGCKALIKENAEIIFEQNELAS